MLSNTINSFSHVVSGTQLLQGLDRPFQGAGQSPVTRILHRAHRINTPNSHILLHRQQCCNCSSCDRGGWGRRGFVVVVGEGRAVELREWRGIACEDLIQCFSPRWVTSVAHNQQIWFCQVYTLYMSEGKKKRGEKMSSPTQKMLILIACRSL